MRNQRFNMMMTRAELTLLRKLANANGMSASDLVRHLVYKAHREMIREADSSPSPRTLRT
jgi:hypothetical protein